MDGLVLVRKLLLKNITETLNSNAGGRCSTDFVEKAEFSIVEQQLLAGGDVSECEAWMKSVYKILLQDPMAGSRLLGASACCCPLAMLISGVQSWLTSLIEASKKDAGSEALQIHILRAISQIFNRLQGISDLSGIRRDVSPLASRSIHIALDSLKLAPTCPAQSSVALELIYSVLTSFPVSVRSQSEALEIALCQIMAGRGPSASLGASAREGSACCLALLPRVSPGTSEAWSHLIKRSLLTLADATDAVFMGLDDHLLASRARFGLEPPSLLGALQNINSTDVPLRHLQPALETLASVVSLIEQLITAHLPAPVSFPGSCLVSALLRLIKFDQGYVLASGRVPPSSSMFTELCGAMPSIKASAWRLLGMIIGLCGPSLCPYHPSLSRLMAEALRRLRARGAGALSSVGAAEREALYRAVADLIRAGGIAAGRQLASEALAVAMIELYGSAPPEQIDSRHNTEGRAHKKAKTTILPVTLEVSTQSPNPHSHSTASEMTAQGAMLGLLTSVLDSCGPLLKASVRAHFDALSIHMATCCTDAAVASIRDTSSNIHAPLVDRLRLLSFQLLLVSVTVPSGHRPPYLSQAMALFKLGRTGGSPEVRSWCMSAIQRMDCLIHPRALLITTAHQVVGSLNDIPALPKPRMWHALDEPRMASDLKEPLLQAAPIVLMSSVTETDELVTKLQPESNLVKHADPSVSAPKGSASSLVHELHPVVNQPPKSSRILRVVTDDDTKPQQPSSHLSLSTTNKPSGRSDGRLPPPERAVDSVADESSDSEGSLPDIDSGDE